MLGVGWPELMIIAVVTVLVVGPKELPRVLRYVQMMTRKASKLARDFQSGMDDLARQADLDELKKAATTIEKDVNVSSFNITDQMDQMLDPQNTIAGMFTGTAISAPLGTPTVGAGNVTALEPPTGAVKIAGEMPSQPIATSTATATNVVAAAIPKKDVVTAEPAEPVPLEKRRAGA